MECFLESHSDCNEDDDLNWAKRFYLEEKNVKCLICPHISRLRRRKLTGGLGQVKIEKMRMTEG